MKIAIVGAGINGLCTAKSLAQRGHEVTLFEQYRPGNPFGSSAGRSRIVRQAYPDQFYTEILLKGHELWYKLETETQTKLIREVGLLFVADQNDEEMLHELDALDNLKVPHRVHTAQDIRQVHSHMVLHLGEIAVMTLSAGWADAPMVLEALQQLGTNLGVDFVQERVTNLRLPQFDRVIVTAGSWVSKFVDLPVQTTLQTYAYLDQEMQGPVWIEGFGDHLYGFPSEPGSTSAKIGFHTPGPLTDADSPDRPAQAEAVKAIQDGGRRRFGLTDPQVVESGCCLYTTANNDDFKIGWADQRTLIASPCSGHGFKFGPWIGEFLADLIDEREDIAQWPRFQVRF